MKRIQCEVCGSASLIKRDDIYECQHCGMQYETDAVRKLLVEIDHSSEVENYLVRAEKFKNEGDYYEAKEYYNKALDFDASNKAANDNLEKIRLIEKWQNYRICNKIMDSNETIESFMKKLLKIDDIACDIYNFIKITSITEKYILGIYYECQLEYNWNATACHNYNEYYYSNGEQRTRTKTRRNPVHGISHYNGEDFFLVSDFSKIFSDYPEKITTPIHDKLENMLKKIKLDYSAIDSEDLSSNCGISIYDGTPIDITYNIDEYQNKKDQLHKSVDKKADRNIKLGIDADSVENYTWTRTVNYRDEIDILIPITAVQYIYKGTKYLAIFDASHSNIVSLSYPIDEEVLNQKNKYAAIQKKYWNYALFLITLSLLITSLGIWFYWTNSISNKLPDEYLYIKLLTDKSLPELHQTAILLVAGIILSLSSFIFAIVQKIKQYRIKKAEDAILKNALESRYSFKEDALNILLDCRNTLNYLNYEAFSPLQNNMNKYSSEIRVKNGVI